MYRHCAIFQVIIDNQSRLFKSALARSYFDVKVCVVTKFFWGAYCCVSALCNVSGYQSRLERVSFAVIQILTCMQLLRWRRRGRAKNDLDPL